MAMTVTQTGFTVSSETEPGRTYTVTIEVCGCCISCTCPDQQHRHRSNPDHQCKHIKIVLAHIALGALGATGLRPPGGSKEQFTIQSARAINLLLGATK